MPTEKEIVHVRASTDLDPIGPVGFFVGVSWGLVCFALISCALVDRFVNISKEAVYEICKTTTICDMENK